MSETRSASFAVLTEFLVDNRQEATEFATSIGATAPEKVLKVTETPTGFALKVREEFAPALGRNILAELQLMQLAKKLDVGKPTLQKTKTSIGHRSRVALTSPMGQSTWGGYVSGGQS